MQKFINPYNFVPVLKENGSSRIDMAAFGNPEEETYSGKIRYTMETISPLFIPNTSSDHAFDIQGDMKKNDNEKGSNKKTGDGKDGIRYDHPSYDFFSYTDLSRFGKQDAAQAVTYHEPVIIGSAIRGAIHSTYEALTNSCLSSVDLNMDFSKRTPERFQPAVLKRAGGKYVLYEAKDYIYRKNKREDFSVRTFEDGGLPIDGGKVYFRKDTISAPGRPKFAKPLACAISEKQEGQKKKGYIVKGEAGPELVKGNGSKCVDCPSRTKSLCSKNHGKRCYFLEKHNAHIFEEGNLICKLTDFESICERMDKILRLYQYNADDENIYREYKSSWKKFKDRESDGIPVYYSRINGALYLSPACITREVYQNTMKDLLGIHEPCKDKKHMCPACALFGMVRGNQAVASRIRFSDAVAEKKMEPEKYYDELLTLPELSTPKISTTEFYLKKPEASKGKYILNWTYDYYVEMDEKGNVQVKSYVPIIQGRKFYWHDLKAAKRIRREQSEIIRTDRNRTVRPVKTGIKFVGDLYFEQITRQQLQELVALLNISNQGEQKYALKIGSGKPCGLGSVKFTVDEVICRKLGTYYDADGEERFGYYNDTKVVDKDKLRADKLFADTSVLKFLRTDAIGDGEISYPYEQKGDEGFKWFEKNREAFVWDNGAKKLNVRKTASNPGHREQVHYKEYMEAGNPVLCDNSTCFFPTSHSLSRSEYEMGKVYSATVTGFNKQETAVYIDLNGSLRIKDLKISKEELKRRVSKGEEVRVQVKYKGKERNQYNGKEYNKWELVE